MANQLAAGSGSGMQFPDQQSPPVFVPPAKSKVFVGSLDWETKSEALQRYFEQFGEIIEAVVIIDKHTGRSKGYGFVTFVDAEAAKLACANPNPVIDNRKANCNLALTGRPAPVRPHGNLGPPYWRTPQRLKVPYLGNSMYQLPFSYGYQPGLPFPMYRYPAYGPEYLYPQIYGVPVTASPKGMLSGQFANPPTTNFQSTAVQNYVTPGPHLVQYGRPIIRAVTPEVTPMQSPHYSGFSVQAPGTPQLMPTSPPQFVPGNGSERMTA